MLPRGAFAPVPTPLGNDLNPEMTSLARHLRWLASEGLDGALILGTNGEFPSFSLNERMEIAEAASAADGLQLMLGIGSCSLPEVLALADHAAACGYGSLLCPPPFYFRSAPVEGLATFFTTVLDEARLPVLLYHIPQVTGVPISDALLDALGDHPRLAGVKDSSGDTEDLQRLSQRFSDGAYLVGSDRLVTASLAAGGTGSISAAASVAPRLVVQVQRGEQEQARLDSLRGLLEDYGLGPSVKSILRRCGLGEFATRPPLLGLDPASGEGLWDAYCRLVPPADRPSVRSNVERSNGSAA